MHASRCKHFLKSNGAYDCKDNNNINPYNLKSSFVGYQDVFIRLAKENFFPCPSGKVAECC